MKHDRNLDMIEARIKIYQSLLTDIVAEFGYATLKKDTAKQSHLLTQFSSIQKKIFELAGRYSEVLNHVAKTMGAA